MSPVEWYYAKGDQRIGPVSAADLKQMVASGKLQPDDLVWREGMDAWATAANVRGLFEQMPSMATPPGQGPAAPARAPGMETAPPQVQVAPGLPGIPGRPSLDRVRRPVGRHLFDIILDAIRSRFTEGFVAATAKIFVACGHYGMYVAMLVSFLFWLIVGIKSDSVESILIGAICVLALAVLQYVASRFCEALDRLNRSTSGTVSSSAFLDCFALLAMTLGLVVLLFSAVAAVQSEQYMGILVGMIVFVVCQYLAFVSLNPKALSLSVAAETRAGEEAIGVISFLLKALLQLVPVAFGAGVVYGTLLLFYACYLVFAKNGSPLEANETAWDGVLNVVRAAALPFATYLVFLLYYLLIDVYRAILVIPGKLDRLAEKDEQHQQ